MPSKSSDPELVQFGPTRGIGLSIMAKPGVTNFGAIWEKQLMPRKGEIARPAQGVAFGVCLCVPGMTDGTFEYVALLEATADAPVPPGMVAVDIPKSTYAVLAVSSYAELGPAWHCLPQMFEAHPEWQPFCGPKGCDCASHPSFEFYPNDPEHTGRAFVYVPVK